MTNVVHVPISIGDLWDKITILNIKKEEYTANMDANPLNSKKIEYVETELSELIKIIVDIPVVGPVNEVVSNLKEVNHMIWRNEEVVRTYGPNGKPYDDEFIRLVTQVHQGNKDRCQYKLDINMLYGSYIVETKSYVNEGLK